MNKTILYQAFTFFMLIGLLSCSKNEDEVKSTDREYKINIKVDYVEKSKDYPDEGAKIYIYFNHKQDDFTGLQYDKEGSYYSETKTIRPDNTYIVNNQGMAIIDFKEHLNVECSIIVESKKRVGLRSFLYVDEFDFKDYDTLKFRFH